MGKIFKWHILNKKEYNYLKHQDDFVGELQGMIKDNDIEKERKDLEQKYKKYIGEWYLSEDGVVFKIERVKYSRSFISCNFCFEASVPNNEDWIDVDIDDVENKKIEHIPKDEVGVHLGLCKN